MPREPKSPDSNLVIACRLQYPKLPTTKFTNSSGAHIAGLVPTITSTSSLAVVRIVTTKSQAWLVRRDADSRTFQWDHLPRAIADDEFTIRPTHTATKLGRQDIRTKSPATQAKLPSATVASHRLIPHIRRTNTVNNPCVIDAAKSPNQCT
jgi:hypothetical protein